MPIVDIEPSSAIVRVGGDLGTASAVSRGIVTKGLGMGAEIVATIGFDLPNPVNVPVLACNTGPDAGPPVTAIALITIPGNSLSIDFP